MPVRDIRIIAMLEFLTSKGFSMTKVMVSFPEDFLKRVDEEARAQDRSRSELIREALRDSFGRQMPRARSWGKALARLRRLEAEWVGKWDSTAVIRSDRERERDRKDRR
jgi:predicted transcriptional regulator